MYCYLFCWSAVRVFVYVLTVQHWTLFKCICTRLKNRIKVNPNCIFYVEPNPGSVLLLIYIETMICYCLITDTFHAIFVL